MKNYYAVVNGVVCYKYYDDGDPIPPRATKTNWFMVNEAEPGDIYWAPVENAEQDFVCNLLAQYFIEHETGDPDGVYIVFTMPNNNMVDKVSNNY